MPLSENEQRILNEIEKHLQESDPHLAREARSSSWGSARRNARLGVVGLIGGLALMVFALQISVLLAFLGFVIMATGAVAIERYLSQHSSRPSPWERLGSGINQRRR